MLLVSVLLLSVGALIWLYSTWVLHQRPVELQSPLAIPPLADSHVDGEGYRVFDLTAQEGTSSFLPDVATPTWGYNGDYLGPTLRAERGEKVRVDVTNALPEATSAHWHGMELPAVMDGGPHQPIEVGQTWSPRWTIDQGAATLWYHPHLHHTTAAQVYRGLAGLFLIDDPVLDGVLPQDYGVDDVPVIIQDRRIDSGGRSEPHGGFMRFTGMLGDVLTVNGTVGPVFDATTASVRLRILNASPARIYNLAFSDGRSFHQVGTDVALLPAPVRMTSLQLSPGERAEIILDMAPGDDVVLRSLEPDLGTTFLSTRLAGGHDTFEVLRVRAAGVLAPSPDLPATLPGDADDEPVPSLSEPDRTFSMEDATISGRPMDHDRIDARILAGSVEVWDIRNASHQPHNWHVHGMRFRVLPVDAAALPAYHQGWKDTVYIPPGGRVRLAIEFVDFPDPHTPFMFHCHLLYHEDNGMMGQFLLVDDPAAVDAQDGDGRGSGSPGREGHHHP